MEASKDVLGRDRGDQGRGGAQPAPPGKLVKGTFAPLLFTCVLLGFVAFPKVHSNPNLIAAFVGAAAVLLVWQAVLWVIARREGRTLYIALTKPQRSHYIQGSVQFSIYAYWGWYWRNVYDAAPLILGQLVFLYVLDALISWSRRREWRIGFAPMPIIFSTNFFLWFKDDWFAYQFVMIALCAFGKEFVRWTRDGKKTHIFNPSAFGLALVSTVLIATNSTQITWGIEVATTLARPPHIFLWIFLAGLVVQYFFAVTLMTLTAVMTIYASAALYHAITGTHYFVDTNIPIAIFLGMHLLVTDPATSPRSNVGKVIFGVSYGLLNVFLFWLLGERGIPDFYDKLLPVPILNLCVPLIDRISRSIRLPGATALANLGPRRLNLIHMAIWITFFMSLLLRGKVDAHHEGSSIAYWKNAYDEGKPFAGRNLVKIIGSLADAGDAAACNQLGSIYAEGEMVAADHGVAAHYFGRACAAGNAKGCENVVWHAISTGYADSGAAVSDALASLESACGVKKGGGGCAMLALAYETGFGRPLDPMRAAELYRVGCERGHVEAAKGRVRLASVLPILPAEIGAIASILEQGRAEGDAESCMVLAHVYRAGLGTAVDSAKADALLDEACRLGAREACDALQRADRTLRLRPPGASGLSRSDSAGAGALVDRG